MTRSLRRVLAPAMAFGFFLMGCGGPQEPGGTSLAFRRAEAPIWSAAAFDPGRLGGRWQQAAAYAAPEAPRCAPGGIEAQPRGEGIFLRGVLCLNGSMQRVEGLARPIGPGRLAVPGMADWWIIWVDADYRTLAVATPGGGFGFVLDRGRIAADRLVAAAEIFDFNGYSKARLRPF